MLHHSELRCQFVFLPRFRLVADSARKLTVEILRLLKKRRLEKNISVYALAQKSGVSQQMIAYVERGERNPTLETVLKIARGLDVSLSKVIKEAEASKM